MEEKKDTDDIHAYYNSKGERIPSVTQIIGCLGKKGVVQWANYLGFKHQSYNQVINERIHIGTLFHEMVEYFLFTGKIKKDIPTFEGINYILNIVVNMIKNVDDTFSITTKQAIHSEKYGIEPIMVEKAFRCEDYAGTIDCLGYFYDPKEKTKELSLIDFKTSKKVYPTHIMQLAGYLNLLLDSDNYEIFESLDSVRIIAVNDTDGIHMKRFSIEEMKKYRYAFYNLLFFFKQYESILQDDWKSSLLDS